MSSDIAVYCQDLPLGTLHRGTDGKWRMNGHGGDPLPVPDETLASIAETLMKEDGEHNNKNGLQEYRLLNWTFRRNETNTDHPPEYHQIPDGGSLRQHIAQGVYQGQHPQDFQKVIDREFRERDFSTSGKKELLGSRPKLTGFMDSDGALCLHDQNATSAKPFTVLVKMEESARSDNVDVRDNTRGSSVLEWASQNAARYAGLETADCALMTAPDKKSAMLISERFDVPDASAEKEKKHYSVTLESATLMGDELSKKKDIQADALWETLKKAGLPDSEAGPFLDRFVTAYVLGDSDLHARNLAVSFDKGVNDTQWSAKLSPAYDITGNRAFERFAHQPMSFSVNGKRDNIEIADWQKLGESLGLSAEETTRRVQSLAKKLAEGMDAMSRHPIFSENSMDSDYQQFTRHLLERSSAIAKNHAVELGVDPASIQKVSPKDLFSHWDEKPTEVQERAIDAEKWIRNIQPGNKEIVMDMEERGKRDYLQATVDAAKENERVRREEESKMNPSQRWGDVSSVDQIKANAGLGQSDAGKPSSTMNTKSGDDAIYQQLSQNNSKLDMYAGLLESFNNQPEIKAARENAAKYGMPASAKIHEAVDQNPALKEQYLHLHKMFHEHIQPIVEKHAELVSQLKDPQQRMDATHSFTARSNRIMNAQKDWPDRDDVMKTEKTNTSKKSPGIGEAIAHILQKLHDLVFGKSKPGAANKDAAENTAQAQPQGKADHAMQTAKDVAGIATAVAAPEVAIAAQVANLAKDQMQPAQKPSSRPKR